MKKLFIILLIWSGFATAQSSSLYLEEISAADLVKMVFGEILHKPFVLSHAVIESSERATLSLRNVQPEEMRRQAVSVLEGLGFSVLDRAGVVVVDRALKDDEEVIVYHPRFRSSSYLADIVQPLTGARSMSSRDLRQQVGIQSLQAGQGMQPHQAVQPAQSSYQVESRTSVAGMTDRSEVDQIALTVPRSKADKLRKLLADLDTPTGEILLKAAVYEVGTTKQQGSALKLAMAVGGLDIALGGSLNVSDASVKFTIGGLDGLLTALDRDSRFRSLSRPQVRIKNGAMARFSVGQDVPILGSAQLDRLGNPVQSVEYKPSGIILSARPEIRADSVELEVNQEMSSFTATNTGVNNSPTLIKRSVNTKLSIQTGEVVILAGLQDEKRDELNSRLPFLGWWLGDSGAESSTEILVFIEALRI